MATVAENWVDTAVNYARTSKRLNDVLQPPKGCVKQAVSTVKLIIPFTFWNQIDLYCS